MDIKVYDKLAGKYDLMTKIISFGIEEIWRKIFINTIKRYIKNGVVIDLASATGEMSKLNFDKMYFVEPSSEMVNIIKEKLKKQGFQYKKNKFIKENKEYIIIKSTAEEFKIDKKVDLITAFMAFRNFDDIKIASENINRHLKKGGYLAIVEMVKKDNLFAKITIWYMQKIVPIFGMLINMKMEYKLLAKSVSSLDEKKLIEHFKNYKIIVEKDLFPIAKLYIVRKNEESIKSSSRR